MSNSSKVHFNYSFQLRTIFLVPFQEPDFVFQKLRDSRKFDLSSYLYPWLYSGSFPLLEVSYFANKDIVLISQKPVSAANGKDVFVHTSQQSNSFPLLPFEKSPTHWKLPLAVFYGDNTVAQYWIGDRTQGSDL